MKLIETEADFDQLKEQKKPMIIDCFAEWCGPCILMGPVFKKWSEKYDNVIFAKIDVDETEELAESLEVEKLPTFLFYNDEGTIENRFEGSDKQKLEKLIEEFCEEHK